MKSIEALEKELTKEKELIEKHKKKATAIEQEIELRKGQAMVKAVKALNFSGQQYDRFLRLLSNKKSVMEAVELLVVEDKSILESGSESSEEVDKSAPEV